MPASPFPQRRRLQSGDGCGQGGCRARDTRPLGQGRAGLRPVSRPARVGVGAVFPRLAGQSAMYIETQLEAWQSGTRHDDPMGLMAGIAKKLDKAEIDDVAAYYAAMPNLPAAQPVAKPAQHAVATPAGTDAHASCRRLTALFPTTNSARWCGWAKAFHGHASQCAPICRQQAAMRELPSRPRPTGRLGAAVGGLCRLSRLSRQEQAREHVCGACAGLFQLQHEGKSPAYGSKVLVALQAYSYFLASGAPVGANMKGRGFPKLKKPVKPFSYARGEKVYAQNCALCHRADGQGQTSADGKMVFPPLWGSHSYNWGAGMGSISNAANFVAANMPLSRGHTLSDQEAWDVAAFVDSHQRPQDPRFTGSVAQTREKYHNSAMSMYGKTVNGVLLGEHSPPSGPQ